MHISKCWLSHFYNISKRKVYCTERKRNFHLIFLSATVLGCILVALFSVWGLPAFRRGSWLVRCLPMANHTTYVLAHRLWAIWPGSYDGLNLLPLKRFKPVKIHFSPLLAWLLAAVKRPSNMEKVVVVTGANRWNSESCFWTANTASDTLASC